MNKLAHIATTLVKNTLSERAMFHVKGGTDNQNSQGQNSQGNQNVPAPDLLSNVLNVLEDEKRRERPGGGINTN